MSISIRARTSAVFVIGAVCAAAVACADATVGADDLGPDDVMSDASAGEASTEVPADDGGDDDATAPADSGDAGPKKLCTADGWCHTELPPKQTLRGVWGDGAGVVWSVSEQGNILRWDGSAWSIAHTVEGALYTIWGSGPTDVWVGGAKGIFHGTGATSASLTWTEFAPERLPVLSIWGSAANDVYSVGNDGTVSQVLHYAGPPSDPDASGWTPDPVLGNITGKLTKIWGNSATDVWTVGSVTEGRNTKDFIWNRSPDADGVSTFKRDDSFKYFGSNCIVSGGFTADPKNRLWFGTYYGSSYMLWGRRTDSTQAFDWTDAFRFSIPQSHYSCGSLIHTGVLAFGTNDLWKYGEFGRLCHWDGTRWDLAAVSIEDLPLKNSFWDAWAPNQDPSGMWVVGDQVAIRKQPVSNP